MKLICERDALDRALHFVRSRANSKQKIAILQNVKLETLRNSLIVTATDMATMSETNCPAEVAADGVTTVAAERLATLIAAMPQGAQVAMELRSSEMHIRCGQSRYKLPVLSADQFPPSSEPTDPIRFSLPCLDVRSLFGEPSAAISINGSRIMLEGGCLYQPTAGQLAVAGADGHRFIRRVLPSDIRFDGRFIVPKAAMAEIVKLATDGDIDFRVGVNLIEATNRNRKFTSRLIDAIYPDIDHLIPKAQPQYLLVDRIEFVDALKRLTGLMNEFSQLDLTWREGEPSLQLSLRGEGTGIEQVTCECDLPAGRISFAPVLLSQMVDAIKGEVLQLHITGPSAGMCLRDPNDADLTVAAWPVAPRGPAQSDTEAHGTPPAHG